MTEYAITMVAYFFDATGFGVARHRSALALSLAAGAVVTAVVRIFLAGHTVAPVVGLVAAALTVVASRWAAKWLAAGGNALVLYAAQGAAAWLAAWLGDTFRAVLAGLFPSPVVQAPAPAVPPRNDMSGTMRGSLLATDPRRYRASGGTEDGTPPGTAGGTPMGPAPLRLVPSLNVETYSDWIPRGAHLPWSEGLKIAYAFGVSKSKFQRDRRAVLDADQQQSA